MSEKNWTFDNGEAVLSARYGDKPLRLGASTNHEIHVKFGAREEWLNAFDLLEAVMEIAERVDHEEFARMMNELL